eukprot:scaffold2470_cov340-Prasinococcus_capsulatus_cf.AAC.4
MPHWTRRRRPSALALDDYRDSYQSQSLSCMLRQPSNKRSCAGPCVVTVLPADSAAAREKSGVCA